MKNIKSIAAALYLGIAAVGLSATPATAVLIDNGLTTLDTDQNLIWLDISESLNRSYNDVAGQFGTGSDFEGYRHATTSEVTTLFTNAGFAPPYFSLPDTSPMALLIFLLGGTIAPTTEEATASGMFDDSDSAPGANVGGATLIWESDDEFFDAAFVTPNIQDPTESLPTVGHWLVRDVATQVSAPAGGALFAMGLIGLGFARRRRAARTNA